MAIGSIFGFILIFIILDELSIDSVLSKIIYLLIQLYIHFYNPINLLLSSTLFTLALNQVVFILFPFPFESLLNLQ